MKIDAHHDFGTRECPACACQVPANENRCPICGYPFPAKSALSRKAPLIAIVLILLILVPILVAALSR